MVRNRSLFGLAFAAAAGAAQAQPAPPVSPAPITGYEYDAQGNATKTIQAPGVPGFNLATRAGYDLRSRKTSITDARSGLTQFGYNGREDLTQVTGPRGLVTQYPRNGLGDATQLVSPDTGTAIHTFDAAGNLETRTDSRGVLGSYSYDALNRLTGIVFSQAGKPNQNFGWAYDQVGAGFSNGIGRLTSTVFPAGSAQYSHDSQGRVLTDTQTVNSATGANPAPISKTVTYTYDPAGNVTSIVYPSGRKLHITYSGGLPSTMSLARNASATPATLVSAIQWQPFGEVKSWLWQLSGGTQLHERLFDAYGRVVRYRLGNTIRDLTYDAADRITAYTHYDAVTGAATPTLNQSFGYDELGRLTSIAATSSNWSIAYDANGNRTSVTQGSSTSNYVTPASSNRITRTTNPLRLYTHDSAGNVTDNGSFSAAGYDLSGRLSTLTRLGKTATYGYDAFGRRVRKFDTSGAASTVVFVYDRQDRLLGEYDSTGQAIREYVWLSALPIAVFMPGVLPAAAPKVYPIHADHLQAPRVVTDIDGNLRWLWLAEPFGTTAPNTNPQGLGAFTFPLRLPGQYADAESGLNDNYFRSYDAGTGRFTQSDPIGLAGGINTYAYVNSAPTMYTDPDGLQAIPMPPPIIPGIPIPGRPSQRPVDPGDASGPQYTPVPRLPSLPDWLTDLFRPAAKEQCPPDEDFCRKRKQYCFSFCQFELDFPGRTGHDNMLRFRACVRKCMNEVGCNY